MSQYVTRSGLQVAAELAGLIEEEVLPETGVSPEQFWQGYAALITELAPENRDLLDARRDLQRRIDAWLSARRGEPWDA